MPPPSSQSDTIAGLHLPDITARSLSYFMLGALTVETVAAHHLQEWHDKEAVDAKNKAARLYMKTLEDAGSRPAQIPVNGKIPANGEYAAPESQRAIKCWRQPGTLSRWLICRNDMEIRSSSSQWM
jgi:hypothetical protein